jgi:hypothetical protein
LEARDGWRNGSRRAQKAKEFFNDATVLQSHRHLRAGVRVRPDGVATAEWRGAACFLVVLGFRSHAEAHFHVLEARPPVTNLYSSAVFIGWGAVFLGILERIYRDGIG